ncbi:MAG TPA: hypothetical protein VIO36_10200 [Anaerolineaceae bacterium]
MLHKHRSTVVFAPFLIAAVLLLSACIFIPPGSEMERTVDQTWQDLVNQVRETASQWVTEQINNLVDDAVNQFKETFTEVKDQVIDFFPSKWQSVQEYFGFDTPPDVGAVSIGITTKTPKNEIKSEFIRVYKEAGGARKIGQPEDVVRYWDDAGEISLLVQYFKGGSFQRSAIVMEDGQDKAYLLNGEWLAFYEDLGGPKEAGVPLSSPETWNIHSPLKVWVGYGRGQRQLFELNGHEYAVFKRKGSENVQLVPIFVWNFYRQEINYSVLGYPLSSYPLDDTHWKDDSRISSRTKEILDFWATSPFHVQIFENGSILFTSYHDRMELIESQALFGIGGLTSGRFLDSIGDIFLREYDAHSFNQNTSANTCFVSTLQHAGVMTKSESLQIMLGEIGKIPAQAALSGSSLLAESVYAKLMIMTAQASVNQIGDTTWPQAGTDVIIGETIDSIYAKGIGEVLSKPASEITKNLLEVELNQINKNRYAVRLETKPDLSVLIPLPSNVTMNATSMTVHLSVIYDPLTNFVSGVMNSQECNQQGYGFYFKYETGDTSTYGKISPAIPGGVWDEKIHFFDIRAGEEIYP